MPFRTVLVPIDLSPCSAQVLAHAVDLAIPTGARLILMTAVDTPLGVREDAPIRTSDDPEPVPAIEVLARDAHQRLLPFVRLAQQSGCRVEERVGRGATASSILHIAKELGADVIVMGTHGRKGVARALLGSVAEAVLRDATVPVMTVRSQHEASCEAGSCAWCQLGVDAVQRQLQAELEG